MSAELTTATVFGAPTALMVVADKTDVGGEFVALLLLCIAVLVLARYGIPALAWWERRQFDRHDRDTDRQQMRDQRRVGGGER